MKKTVEEKELGEERYQIPSQILEKIKKSKRAKEYYAYIFEVAKRCVECIEDNDFQGAQEECIEMINKLKKELL